MTDSKERNVSRRDVLKIATAGAVGVVAAGLAGCKKGEGEKPPEMAAPGAATGPDQVKPVVSATSPKGVVVKDGMQYRTFGKTGELVSTLGFGCMRLPFKERYSIIDEKEATRLIHYAMDHGVNYFDTAYPYHGKTFSEPGSSEPFLGRALQGGRRDRVKLATKLPCWLVKDTSDFDRLLNEQLKRLRTDHIDFYLLHALGSRTWPTMKKLEAVKFLERAKKDGRIKHAGFSFHDSQGTFMEIIDYWDWDFTMIQFNYMDEQYQAGRAGLEKAKQKGLGVVAMEPLRGGLLARPLGKEAQALLDGTKLKRSNAEWSFRWLWNDPGIHVVLSGMNRLDHIKENIRVASQALPGTMEGAELATIAKVQAVFQKLKAVPCTACRYCMPCPEGVDIPKNLRLYNDYHMDSVERRDKTLKRRYKSRVTPKQSASACTACGKCTEHCPQKIPIPETMAKIVKLVGKV